MWLKDQIGSVLDPTNFTAGATNSGGLISRSNFSELKPYCDETGNIIRVKPGRFTARINDAYNITPLQFLTRLTGDEVAGYNSWTARTGNDVAVSAAVNLFKSNILQAANSLNMNGLTERAFSYPAYIPDKVSSFLASSTPSINNLPGAGAGSEKQPPYPLIQAQLWNQTTVSSFTIKQYDNTALVGFANLGSA